MIKPRRRRNKSIQQADFVGVALCNKSEMMAKHGSTGSDGTDADKHGMIIEPSPVVSEQPHSSREIAAAPPPKSAVPYKSRSYRRLVQ
jgi:hypothetical protein